MEGAKYFANYRMNYMLDSPEWRPTVISGFQRMRLLEQWGIGKSYTPSSICVILSRTSEDWWEVKMEGVLGQSASESIGSTVLYSGLEDLKSIRDTDTKTRELNYERFRGMASGKCVEELLIENGISYDVKFAERSETLSDLNKYKLLILPFAYSLSKESFNAIQKAVDSGTKLLIIDQVAPTDEYGNPYPEPLLKSLLDKNNVVYENINLSRKGMLKSIRKQILADVKRLTGETGIRFEPDGRTEFLIRKVEDGSLILYLANWEYESKTPILGLDLPEGKYEITLCGGDNFVLKEGILNGQKQPTASAFKNFRLSLAPREVVLIYIKPAKISQ